MKCIIVMGKQNVCINGISKPWDVNKQIVIVVFDLIFLHMSLNRAFLGPSIGYI